MQNIQDLETGKTAIWRGVGGAPFVTHFCKYKVVTDDATGLNIASGPAVLFGVVLIAAGTMASVYDGLTATGNVIIPSTTATVTFGGLGIWCPTGITADWTSGTWLVLYNNT